MDFDGTSSILELQLFLEVLQEWLPSHSSPNAQHPIDTLAPGFQREIHDVPLASTFYFSQLNYKAKQAKVFLEAHTVSLN